MTRNPGPGRPRKIRFFLPLKTLQKQRLSLWSSRHSLGTVKDYDSRTRLFEEFCSHLGCVAFPVHVDTLSLFIAQLFRAGYKSILNFVYAVKDKHKDVVSALRIHERRSPFDDHFIKGILKGVSMEGDLLPARKPALSWAGFKTIIRYLLSSGSHFDLLNAAVIALAFEIVLRRAEYTYSSGHRVRTD